MSIQIFTKGYNMCKVFIPDALTLNAKAKVGIKADFDFIIGLVKMSGVILGECKIGTQVMKGAMIANPWANDDGIECFTISMAGAQAPYIFQLQVTLEDGEMYVTPSITYLT